MSSSSCASQLGPWSSVCGGSGGDRTCGRNSIGPAAGDAETDPACALATRSSCARSHRRTPSASSAIGIASIRGDACAGKGCGTRVGVAEVARARAARGGARTCSDASGERPRDERGEAARPGSVGGGDGERLRSGSRPSEARRSRYWRCSRTCCSICSSITRCSSACMLCCSSAESGPRYSTAYPPRLQNGQLCVLFDVGGAICR